MKSFITLFLLTFLLSDASANESQKYQELQECYSSLQQYHKHEARLMGEIEIGESAGQMAKIHAKNMVREATFQIEYCSDNHTPETLEKMKELQKGLVERFLRE